MSCSAPVPREVEVSFQIGPKEVVIAARFEDLRLRQDDPVISFRQIAMIDDAARAARSLHTPGLERSSRYELVARDDRLDLSIEAALGRSDFDRCVTECARKDEQRCGWLPIRRCGTDHERFAPSLVDGYELRSDIPAHWPADTTKIMYALVSRAGSADGPSALAAFRRYRANREASTRLADWMDAVDRAFDDWQNPAASALVSAPPAELPPDLRALANTYVARMRLRLLQAALSDSGITAQDAPAANFRLELGPRAPVLTAPMPKVIARRLAKAHRDALRQPKEHVALFRDACSVLSDSRNLELASLCAMLGAR